MAYLTEIFKSGVVDPSQNEALHRLSALLGNALVFGSGSSAGAPGGPAAVAGNDGNTLLIILSSALTPVYVALLFLILAWIAVGGTVKSALDGEFLGRDWSSVGVPASLIFTVILLSPIPASFTGGSGTLTLAQVVYVKGITLGSNFGDLVLKTAVESANQKAVTDQYTRAGVSDDLGRLKYDAALYSQVNDRMLGYLPNYLCAEQLVASGINRQYTFYITLANLCKVPVGSQGLYDSYFNATMPALTKGKNGEEIEGEVPVGKRDTSSDKNPRNKAALEYSCYYDAFKSNFTSPEQIPASLRQKFSLIPGHAAVTTPTIYPSASSPAYVADPGSVMKSVGIDQEAMKAAWWPALERGVNCIKSKGVMRDGIFDYFTGVDKILNPMRDEPWAKGWAMAAAFNQTTLNNANKRPGEPLALNTDIIPPNPDGAAKTQGGPRLRAAIMDLTNESLKLHKPINDMLSNMQASILADPSLANQAPTATTQGHGNYSDERRIFLAALATGASAGLLANPAARAPALNAVRTAFTPGQGAGILSKFSSAMGEKVVENVGGGIAKRADALRTALKGMQNKVMLAKLANDGVDDVAKNTSIPFAGGVVVAANAAKKILTSQFMGLLIKPGMLIFFFTALTILDIMTLAPEIAMTIALLVWLLRVAAWFLVIPISVVLMALPKTSVGHNAWKEALALALTPGLTMLFFVVSMLMIDIVIDVSSFAMFQPYLEAYNGNSAIVGGIAMAAKLVADLLSGELVYRVIAWCMLCSLGYFFCIYLILRGPVWAMNKLGLGSQELGATDDLERLIKRPKTQM